MSLYKIFKLLCIPIIIVMLFSGCKDSNNLKDIIIVEGMGIDSNEQGGTNLSIRMLNVAKSASNGEAPSGIMTQKITDKGESLVEAISFMSKKLSKDLFFGQTKIVVIGKSVAEAGMDEHLDYFLRSTDTRSDVALCLSDTTASKILDSKEHESRVPCENILYLLQNSEAAGFSAYITTGQVLNLYNDKTSDIYIPVLKGDKNNEGVTAEGIAVFSNDKMTAVLNDEETNGFLLIADKVHNFKMKFEDERFGKVGVEFFDIKVKNHATVENSQIVFKSYIYADMIIDEIENDYQTSISIDESILLCQLAGRQLEKNCKAAFSACQNAGSDSLRVGEYVARDLPQSYEKCSDNWKDYFKSSKIEPKAEVSIKKITESTKN
ncbi:MAG: Ger(x)C family spore germination protein [Eubacterium sp.]|nr:Ger(x)C family spore germination protein [Eubacterium sp.]